MVKGWRRNEVYASITKHLKRGSLIQQSSLLAYSLTRLLRRLLVANFLSTMKLPLILSLTTKAPFCLLSGLRLLTVAGSRNDEAVICCFQQREEKDRLNRRTPTDFDDKIDQPP